MGDDDEVHLHVTYASHVDMDVAFCARLRMAIESRARKCADWCHHHAWDAKSQIRPSRASLAASLLAARYELLVVAGRVNWSRISSRNRMRRQGVEDIKGKMPSGGELPKQPRRKLSKAELREQAAAAFLAWREGQTAKDK
jgi:hypothetical protein